ncbi:MAG TPA: hypothetical protein VF041_23190 [Gemmatimonadaceae bacterium]
MAMSSGPWKATPADELLDVAAALAEAVPALRALRDARELRGDARARLAGESLLTVEAAAARIGKLSERERQKKAA